MRQEISLISWDALAFWVQSVPFLQALLWTDLDFKSDSVKVHCCNPKTCDTESQRIHKGFSVTVLPHKGGLNWPKPRSALAISSTIGPSWVERTSCMCNCLPARTRTAPMACVCCALAALGPTGAAQNYLATAHAMQSERNIDANNKRHTHVTSPFSDHGEQWALKVWSSNMWSQNDHIH